GAASPNMGRATSPALVALMTLLNIRMGFWLPNPGQLESWTQERERRGAESGGGEPPGFSFDDVFRVELQEIQNRWAQLADGSERNLATQDGRPVLERTPRHDLAGIGFSGGGIRSAALNLGMTQALDQRGVFEHFDYMSTVSGGGYLGSSLSTLMRRRSVSEPSVRKAEPESSVGDVFRWRVRPIALVREILGKLDETSRWVNVSDGGHLENLAAIELLRRQCRYIIIGDGEADPDHQFTGLATLIRTARIDLGVRIDMNVDEIRLKDERISQEHWAIGRIHYPNQDTYGHLLYLKSSFTGREDVVIQQYRSRNPSFPHESTADQAFTEGQFEAYRSLGQHIAEQALEHANAEREMSFADLEQWFEELDRHRPAAPKGARAV
ncbi:MAG: patatin-like phospholipase family protein, partial [Myxococcota bacterium]